MTPEDQLKEVDRLAWVANVSKNRLLNEAKVVWSTIWRVKQYGSTMTDETMQKLRDASDRLSKKNPHIKKK